MPLTVTENIVHQNTGGVATSAVGTPITVSLAGGDTTEDSSVVFVFLAGYHNNAGGESGVTFAAQSGFRLLYTLLGSGAGILYRSSADGLADGESSWDFTPATVGPTGGPPLAWAVLEVSGLDPVVVIDAAAAAQVDAGTGPTTTMSSTSRNTVFDGMFFAVHMYRDANNATPATWASHTASYAEVVEAGQAGTGVSVGVSVSALPVSTPNTYPMAATANRVWVANEVTRISFSVLALNAARQVDLVQMDGGESSQVGTITGNVTLVSGSARSGALGYRLDSTAAACSKALATGSTALIAGWPAYRLHFRLDDLTDRAQIWYFTYSTTGSQSGVATLRLTGGVLGLNWSGTGTMSSNGEQFSQAVSADQWIGVDIRADYRDRGTLMIADWAVDYNAELTDTEPAVLQTRATASPAVWGTFLSAAARVGWSSSLTSGMDFDDYGQAPGHNFPIGDLRVLPLKVDPAATPTVTGATTNFGVMTANGTVAAWNAVNARNAVDDIPPIAAGDGARDAAVAILAHATDTANFPMETHALAANKVNVRGVKAHWWLWAATTTATTIRIFVSDGTTTHTVYAEANPTAGPTTQVYTSAMVRTTVAPEWTQAKVDGLEFRFGSNDANPDIGLDAMLLELAVVKALPESLFGQADEPIYIEAQRDPATYALVGATITNNSGEAIELAWEVDGVPDSSGSIPDGTVEQYVPLSPDGTIETVGVVSVIPG